MSRARFAGVAAVALLPGVGSGSACRSGRADDPLCVAYRAGLPGITAIAWDNGIPASGAIRFTVITDGVRHANDVSRDAMAKAVVGDDPGFHRVRAALPEADRGTADLRGSPNGPGRGMTRVPVRCDGTSTFGGQHVRR